MKFIDEEGFSEEDENACVLMQYQILKIIKQNKGSVTISVLMGLLLKNFIYKGMSKNHFMELISESWDTYEKEMKPEMDKK